MKKVIFNMSDSLVQQVEIAIERWGFKNRGEFIRHACIEFLRNDGRLIPADETLRAHQKTIVSVKAKREADELTTMWVKENPYMHKSE